MSIDLEKQILRSKMLEKRKLLTNTQVNDASHSLLNNLKDILLPVKNVAIYHAYKNEISLEQTIQYLLAQHKRIYKPIAYKSSRIMRFDIVNDLSKNTVFADENYNYKQEIECYNLDLILLPLVAVDNDGYRLGQGGGYYDSTFEKRNPNTILCGVGYQWQYVNSVPHDKFDIKLDMFVSDEKTTYFK